MARAPSVHSISAPSKAPLLHHHHDHEHHHHHSHYEREVKEDGAVIEKTITEDVVETPAGAGAAPEGAAAGEAAGGVPTAGGAVGGEGGKKGKKRKNKGKNKVVDDAVVDETILKGPTATDPIVAPIDSISQAPSVKAPIVKAPSVRAPSIHSVAPAVAADEQEAEEVVNEKTKEVIVTKTTTTRTIQPAPDPSSAPVAPASRAPSIRAPSIRAPSVKAPTRPPTIIEPIPAAPSPKPSIHPLAINAAPPPSPAPSHRSHRSHHSMHQAPVIVNVTIPQPAAPAVGPPVVVAPAPAALPAPLPAQVTVAPPTIVEPIPVAQTSQKAPSRAPTVLASPARSVKIMKLPSALRHSKEPAPALVVPVPEEVVEMDHIHTLDNGNIVETKVVTTTTTKRSGSPPALAPAPAVSAPPPTAPEWTQYVRNVTPPAPAPPRSVAPPPAPSAPPPVPQDSPQRFVETTTVGTVSYPVKVPAASVDTGATTVGNPTTAGAGGARSAVLTEHVQPIGTKAGIRPIPYIDYSNLVRQMRTPGIHLMTVEAPPSEMPTPKAAATKLAPTMAPTRCTAPAAKSARSPPAAVPQTIASLVMDVDRDSDGREHIHATLRDRRGTKKIDVDQTPATNRGLDLNVDDEVLESITVVEEKQRKKDKRKKSKKDKEKGKDRSPEPLYKPIAGALPPPKSERYAAPPALDEIENKARERFEKKWMPGGGDPHQPLGGWRGLSFPPMAPPLLPRAPPLMAPTPGMFGPPLVNPYMLGQMGMTPPVMPPGGMPGMYPTGVPGMGPVMPFAPDMGTGLMGYPGVARSMAGGMPMQPGPMGMGMGMGMMPGMGMGPGVAYGMGMMGGLAGGMMGRR